ncbi:MAG TPA: hypothetical protein VGQ38_07735 [Gaiellaceae bacterium]|jgi:hypothetical protein|nr:hypothetical protein [Gaiellaceae bacterium]
MMTGGVLVLEAIVPFATISGLGLDSTPLSILLSGKPGEHAAALLRVDRPPSSETDVIGATGELVTRAGLVLSRWELRERHGGSVVAGSEMSPIALRPFAPCSCVVRLFGDGATATATTA